MSEQIRRACINVAAGQLLARVCKCIERNRKLACQERHRRRCAFESRSKAGHCVAACLPRLDSIVLRLPARVYQIPDVHAARRAAMRLNSCPTRCHPAPVVRATAGTPTARATCWSICLLLMAGAVWPSPRNAPDATPSRQPAIWHNASMRSSDVPAAIDSVSPGRNTPSIALPPKYNSAVTTPRPTAPLPSMKSARLHARAANGPRRSSGPQTRLSPTRIRPLSARTGLSICEPTFCAAIAPAPHSAIMRDTIIDRNVKKKLSMHTGVDQRSICNAMLERGQCVQPERAQRLEARVQHDCDRQYARQYLCCRGGYGGACDALTQAQYEQRVQRHVRAQADEVYYERHARIATAIEYTRDPRRL